MKKPQANVRCKASRSADSQTDAKATRAPTGVMGARIRQRRKELGLGLQQLAERTGLTASFLSLVERNLTGPSLDSLRRIAEALDVPLFYFAWANSHNPVVRRNQRVLLTFPKEKLTSELLVPNLRGRLEVFISRGKPGTGNIARIPAQDSEEVIYVMKGTLRVQLYETEYELNAGDSIYFHTSALREIHVQGKREAMWLTAITPPVL
ncbi:MAG: XRE family transcriptional regulator [Anaerolineae bacterium]|nr:XRE family transcriptional regulator [Candidatus Roseilinea sp.]MDW8451166.1 XRE family transcriptional regulator [Anaerolineae bacterium]